MVWNRLVGPLAALSLGLAAMPASAGVSWTFTGSNCVSGCGSSYDGNALTFDGAGGAGNVTASAWSNTGSGGDLQTGTLNLYSGGLGVTNQGESGTPPNHSTDNSGYIDSILFDFGGDAVDLSDVSVGWWYNDSDISVLAYTGSGDPTADLGAGNTYNDLLGSGWSLVGNYDNVGQNGGTATVNPDDVSSSYWLIGALNTDLTSTSCSSYSYSYSTSNCSDYVKIYALAGDTGNGGGTPPSQVPVPGTLALFGLGLLLTGLRRR